MATQHEQISLQELEAAVRKMAWIVETFGETYWPIFDRLDRELQQRKTRALRLAQYNDETSIAANDQSESIYPRNTSETG